MSDPWHEVLARGRYRIVAFDRESDASAPYAVTTDDGALVRRDLLLPEARRWLEHFADRDVQAPSEAAVPPGHARPRRRAR